MTASEPAALRTSRAEQAAITRARLINAAIELLVESGYSKMSTTAVCARAGVSRGAQVHHFSTKIELTQAVIEELASRMGRTLRRETKAIEDEGGDRIGRVIDVLWARFSSPEAMAILELWVASRGDAEVAAVLRPVQSRLESSISDEIGRAFAGHGHPNLAAVMAVTVRFLEGMLANRILERSGMRDQEQLRCEQWKELARQLLA